MGLYINALVNTRLLSKVRGLKTGSYDGLHALLLLRQHALRSQDDAQLLEVPIRANNCNSP